jgi:hemerythrin-like metal-binding protein
MADLMTFTDDYKVNIAHLDEQHKKLMGMINDLNNAMESGSPKDVVGDILNNLAVFAANHFKAEETLFDAHGYPETDSHKAKHVDLTNQVIDFLKKFQDGAANVTPDLMAFLKNWLSDHILGTDKKYAPYLNAKGVA